MLNFIEFLPGYITALCTIATLFLNEKRFEDEKKLNKALLSTINYFSFLNHPNTDRR